MAYDLIKVMIIIRFLNDCSTLDSVDCLHTHNNNTGLVGQFNTHNYYS